MFEVPGNMSASVPTNLSIFGPTGGGGMNTGANGTWGFTKSLNVAQAQSGGYILYNGQEVQWVSNGTVVASYPAASGLPGYQDPKYQSYSDKGPIPEGLYSINLIPDPNRIAKVHSTGELLSNPNGGIEQIPSSFTTPNGTTYTYPGWGTIRARLQPSGGTNTFGRYAFYLHDSSKGYTHGCIECSNSIFGRLLRYRSNHSSIQVRVKY